MTQKVGVACVTRGVGGVTKGCVLRVLVCVVYWYVLCVSVRSVCDSIRQCFYMLPPRDVIFRLSLPGTAPLPDHTLSPGDIVLLSKRTPGSA